MSLKQHRENELKMQNEIYSNILLLTNLYPPSKEFEAQFRKDMFHKSNKAAFHEMVYYLLHVLNDSVLKEKISVWPVYDIKGETKFRNELLKYINELNSLYDAANIPKIMSSTLISPCGYKFLKFMLRLSQLVIYVVLKEENYELILPIHRSKNVEIQKCKIGNLHCVTSAIEKSNKADFEEYEKFHEEMKIEASNLVKEQEKLNSEIASLKLKLEELKHNYEEKCSTFPSVDNLREQLQDIEEENKKINRVYELCYESQNLLQQITTYESVLSFNKDNLKLPPDMAHLINKDDPLNLLKYFAVVKDFLQKQLLELPSPPTVMLKRSQEKVDEINKKLEKLHVGLSEKQIKLSSMLQNCKNFNNNKTCIQIQITKP